jgi:hypothetical protein
VNGSTYSSLTAFIAHLRALRSLTSPDQEQSPRLAEMESIINELSPGERESLQTIGASGGDTRHRQRSERHLIQILRNRGILSP